MLKLKQKRFIWEGKEDALLLEVMVEQLDRGIGVTNASKIASEILKDEGFDRSPSVCAARWYRGLNKELANKAEILAEEEIETEEIKEEILPEPEENILTLEEALTFITNRIYVLEEENKKLKERYSHLKELLSISL